MLIPAAPCCKRMKANIFAMSSPWNPFRILNISMKSPSIWLHLGNQFPGLTYANISPYTRTLKLYLTLQLYQNYYIPLYFNPLIIKVNSPLV